MGRWTGDGTEMVALFGFLIIIVGGLAACAAISHTHEPVKCSEPEFKAIEVQTQNLYGPQSCCVDGGVNFVPVYGCQTCSSIHEWKEGGHFEVDPDGSLKWYDKKDD